MDEDRVKAILTRLFKDLGEEIEGAAREARNDAAREALYSVAHNVSSLDIDWMFRVPVEVLEE